MEIRTTADGSDTIYSSEFNETYHSINGAITESVHVFIESGFKQLTINNVSVLEIGFGTGLNAFLTLKEAKKEKKTVSYLTIERFPISENLVKCLNYSEIYSPKDEGDFQFLHQSEWGKEIPVTNFFKLTKINTDIVTYDYGLEKYDVVYFDAFSPNIQPELWTYEIFKKIYQAMKFGGVLTTYCAKGEVRRNMKAAGFIVERLPGPPGKREMLRGTKK